MRSAGWVSRDKIDIQPMLCETVGYVVAQSPGSIATSPGHDGQVDPYISGSYSVCPKRMIVDMKILKKSNPKIWTKK